MKKILSIIILMLLFIVSCGGKHITQKDFENSMSAVQKGDISALTGENSETAQTLKIFSEGYKKITYKINNTSITDSESVLNVTMKAPVLTGIMEEAEKKAKENIVKLAGKSEKEIEEESKKIILEIISQKLSSPDLKYSEETFDVVYTKKNGKWELSPEKNEKFLKVITLGILM